MKKTLFILIFAVIGLSSCKKDPNLPPTLTPAASLIFNDNLDAVSGSFVTGSPKGTGTVSIKIAFSDNVKQLKFTTPTGSVVNDLGTVSVSGGVYTFTKLVKDLRGTADAPLPTSGSSGSVVLTVTAILADGTTLRRLFTITVTT